MAAAASSERSLSVDDEGAPGGAAPPGVPSDDGASADVTFTGRTSGLAARRERFRAQIVATNLPITPMRNSTYAAFAFIGIVTIALALVALVGRVRTETGAGYGALIVVYTLVPIGVWLFISSKLPRAEGTTWATLLPGAVVFGIGTQILHLVTVLWIARSVSSKTETYGAIGAALALLLWAYLLGRVITASAALNAALWYRSRGRLRREAVPDAEVDPESRAATP
jgi:hypothetical protein